jgi:hypothetical protein
VTVTTDGVRIGNWIYWTLTFVTTNNYDSFTELHISNITATTANIHFSQFSLAVAWWRLPMTDFHLPLCSSILRVPRNSWRLLYCLSCETPLNLEDQFPKFISPRNRVTSYTPRQWAPFSSPPTTRTDMVEVFEPANQFVLASSPLRLTARMFFFPSNSCGHSPYIISSLKRG